MKKLEKVLTYEYLYKQYRALNKTPAEERITLFEKHGYKCVIIWGSKNYPKIVKQELEKIGYNSKLI